MEAVHEKESEITTHSLLIKKHIPKEHKKELMLEYYTVAIVPKKQAHRVMQTLK